MVSADSRAAIELLLTFFLFVVQITFIVSETEMNASWSRYVELNQNDLYNSEVYEKVSVIVLYESLCPDCIDDYGRQILPTVQQLGDYIDLKTYPYGNAQRSTDSNGHVTIKCQHGEAECYGNKLHACAIDVLQNEAARYVEFNGCMMPLRSNDAAADQCGQKLQVESTAIKRCAKSDRGFKLLNYYADLSGNFQYDEVPTKFVNYKNILDKHLKQAVCDALKNTPAECKQ